MLIISLTLGLSLGDLNLRCHCVRLHPPNASDIEITIQRCEKCQLLESLSPTNFSHHHSSITHQERSKGKLHMFDFLFGTNESAYNAINILIITHSSITMFFSHIPLTPRDFWCPKCALVNSFVHGRKLYKLTHMTNEDLQILA